MAIDRTSLYKTEAEKVRLVDRNILLQYDEAQRIFRESDGSVRLTSDLVRRLQYFAVKDIYGCAGHYRQWGVTIKHAQHVPPEPRYVPDLVDEMCETANRNEEWEPLKTAAYLMWRLNWIHPFGGGNGRTARILSFLALCVRLDTWLPGKLTIAEQIKNDRHSYQDALEDADAAWKEHSLDVSKMESLLARMLERQLASREDGGI